MWLPVLQPHWLPCFPSYSLYSFVLPSDLGIVIPGFSKVWAWLLLSFQISGLLEEATFSGLLLVPRPIPFCHTNLFGCHLYLQVNQFIFLLACLRIYHLFPSTNTWMCGGGFYLFMLCFSPVPSTELFSGVGWLNEWFMLFLPWTKLSHWSSVN